MAFTLDTYAHVIPGMDAETAHLVAGLVIGSPDGSPDGAAEVPATPPADNSADNNAATAEPGEEVKGDSPAQ